MSTGTNDKNEVGRIVQSFINQGYNQINVKQDSLGQWIITAS